MNTFHEQPNDADQKIRVLDRKIEDIAEVLSRSEYSGINCAGRINLLNEKRSNLDQRSPIEQIRMVRRALNEWWYSYLAEVRESENKDFGAALPVILPLEWRLEQAEHVIREYITHEGPPRELERTGSVPEGLKALGLDAPQLDATVLNQQPPPRALQVGGVPERPDALQSDAAWLNQPAPPRALQLLAGAGEPAQTLPEIDRERKERVATARDYLSGPHNTEHRQAARDTILLLGTIDDRRDLAGWTWPPPITPPVPSSRWPSPRVFAFVLVSLLVVIVVLSYVVFVLSRKIAPSTALAETATSAAAETATSAAVVALPPTVARPAETATSAAVVPALPTATVSTDIATSAAAVSALPTATRATTGPAIPPTAVPATQTPVEPTPVLLTVQGVRAEYDYDDLVKQDQFGAYTRLRLEPHVDSTQGAYLRNEDQIRVLGDSDGWYKVRITKNGDNSQVGQEGWIERWLVDNKNVPPKPTPIPPTPTQVPLVVPDVRGADVGQARTFLQGRGFKVAVSVLPVDQVGALCNGWVSYSSPKAGSHVLRGTLVRLYYRGFDIPNPPGCG